MAFSPLSTRISNNEIPEILAGPILRRIEKNRVTVWYATRNALPATLKIYDDDAKTTLIESGGTSVPIQIGTNLYISQCSLVPSSPLSAATIYYYDLDFGGGDTLDSPGMLNAPGSSGGNIAAICINSDSLPSFILPADNLDNLRLLHASCRKPTGELQDALTAAHTILEDDLHDTVKRPQQLFLTGDQIYADDVGDVLLAMIRDAESALVGWDDTFAGVTFNTDWLKPGSRHEILDEIDFTPEKSAGKSHLLKFGEFFAMYLFVWSDSVWPANVPADLPTYAQSESTSKEKNFNKEYGRVDSFFLYLDRVKKALANIATYMVFDDHDVSDDFFIHRKWSEETLAKLVPGKVIRNGMTAIAMCQAWGNDPAYYGTGEGIAFLNLMADIGSNSGNDPVKLQSLFNTVVPKLGDPSGTPVTGIEKQLVKRISGLSLDWHYAINFEKHQVLGLDCRTRRGFDSPNILGQKDQKAALLSDDAVKEQITDQLAGRPASIELTVVLAPSPVFQLPFIPKLKNFVGFFSNVYTDAEEWDQHKRCFEHLLEALVPFEHVLILSGDIHFAFSNATKYWDERSYPTINTAAIVQLCSSPLKNEDWKTRSTGDPDEDPYMTLGWTSTGNKLKTDSTNDYIYIGNNPALREEYDESEDVDDAPQWRYETQFAKDNRTPGGRGSVIVGSTIDPTLPTQTKRGFKVIHINDWDDDRMIVGRNNMGDVTFNWSTQKEVIHNLHYTTREIGHTWHPYTKHVMSIELPNPAGPKPGDP